MWLKEQAQSESQVVFDMDVTLTSWWSSSENRSRVADHRTREESEVRVDDTNNFVCESASGAVNSYDDADWGYFDDVREPSRPDHGRGGAKTRVGDHRQNGVCDKWSIVLRIPMSLIRDGLTWKKVTKPHLPADRGWWRRSFERAQLELLGDVTTDSIQNVFFEFQYRMFCLTSNAKRLARQQSHVIIFCGHQANNCSWTTRTLHVELSDGLNVGPSKLGLLKRSTLWMSRRGSQPGVRHHAGLDVTGVCSMVILTLSVCLTWLTNRVTCRRLCVYSGPLLSLRWIHNTVSGEWWIVLLKRWSQRRWRMHSIRANVGE